MNEQPGVATPLRGVNSDQSASHRDAATTRPVITIYTDGAVSGNGKTDSRGGWAAVLKHADGVAAEISGSESPSTNNRCELMAAIKALEYLSVACDVVLYTDSEYVQKGITEWMAKWAHNGWRTANRQPVKNRDLWERLDAATQRHRVEWHWVKGHAGHPENERVDQLAVAAVNKQPEIVTVREA